jgi:hypothetical protein
MTDRKLIVPVELKVCATCTYWDGARSVDGDVRVVVVRESCEGECLVREVSMPSLRAVHEDSECLWDAVYVDASLAEEKQTHKLGS